jgi:hypothetical protein
MANDLALEADPIVQPLRELVESSGGAWTGTASALWKELKARSDDEARRQRGWPKAANVLSGNLRRLAPNLRAIGISYRQDRETSGTRRRLIVLTATERSAEASRSDQPDQQSDVA